MKWTWAPTKGDFLMWLQVQEYRIKVFIRSAHERVEESYPIREESNGEETSGD